MGMPSVTTALLQNDTGYFDRDNALKEYNRLGQTVKITGNYDNCSEAALTLHQSSPSIFELDKVI